MLKTEKSLENSTKSCTFAVGKVCETREVIIIHERTQ